MAKSQPKNKFKAAFERSATCPVIVASGVWGTATPDGHLSIQLYIERAPIPKSVDVQQVGSSLVQVGAVPADADSLRTVVGELILSPNVAFQLSSLIGNIFNLMKIDTKPFLPDPAAQAVAAGKKKP